MLIGENAQELYLYLGVQIDEAACEEKIPAYTNPRPQPHPPSPRYSCSLGYISGWAGARLDSVSFHWRCPPKAPQYEVVEGLGGHNSGAVAGAPLAWGALVVGALVLLL